MSESGGVEDNSVGTSSINTDKEVSEIRTLKQEAVKEQRIHSPFNTAARRIDSAGSGDGHTFNSGLITVLFLVQPHISSTVNESDGNCLFA